jgi:cytochrome c556
MNKRAGILASICTGMAGIGLVACGGGGGGSDPNSPEYLAYMERDAFMQELGDAILVLNDMASEDIPVDEAAFLAAARTIATRSPAMLDYFENQTLAPESRTKPEVFANWDDFVTKHGALVQAANALAEATASGGFAAGRSLVAPMRDTCGGCHRPYRAPEQE